MSESVIIIHNPRCSKSRQTMELLHGNGVDPEIIEYLNGELSEALLRKAIKALGKKPKELLRTKEDEFKALNLNVDDDEAVIEAIVSHPKILERPIVIKGDKAAVGRPPENVLDIL